jgi:hypothetical protein
MDDEPRLVSELADDLDGYGGGISDALAVVGTGGESVFDERMPRLLEQRHCAITILHVGRVGKKTERTPVGIDHDMALASHHLFAGVVATWTTSLGRHHALTVDDRCRGAWLPTEANAVNLNQVMVEAFENRLIPLPENHR